MRIRKRLPPSSLSSALPLSDPQPINLLPAVQQHVQPAEEGQTHLQPSDPDQSLMIGSSWTLWSPRCKPQKVKQKELEGEEVGEDRWREEEKCNDIGKGSIFGAEVGCEARPPSGSSHYVVPFKKRRGMYKNEMEMIKKTNARVVKTSKTNKKYAVQNNGTDEQEERESSSGYVRERKNKRGSVIMEGSRCSRVNGRGWRCCQQTLVGYSLCEHHLGKGRLRSMSSVRGGSTMPNNHLKLPTTTTAQHDHTLVQEKQEGNDMVRLVHYSSTTGHCTTEEEEDEEKKLVVTKKRMKLGMVKARSIRSLLGQTNSAVVVADNITKTVAHEDK